MNAAERIAQIKAAAARLDTKWPHGADLMGFTVFVYTQANAPGDENMLILAEALYARGVKVVLYDANACQRTHPLRTIPSVFIELDGALVAKVEVEEAVDADIIKWLAVDGQLDLAAIRARVVAAAEAAAKAAQDKATAADEEAANNEGMRALVLDTMSKDATLSVTAKAFMRGMLLIAPGDLVATAAREMMTEMGDVEVALTEEPTP